MAETYLIKHTAYDDSESVANRTSSSFTIGSGELNGAGGIARDSDLSLYGFGTVSWGQGVNQNIFRLLENYACPAKVFGDYNPATMLMDYDPVTDPVLPKDENDLGLGNGITNPVIGQQWFNTSANVTYTFSLGNIWSIPTGGDATLLDGLDSTQFLRSDVADIMQANEPGTLLIVNQQGAGAIIDLQSAGGSVLTALSNGSVGINQPSPSTAFEVVGDTELNGATTINDDLTVNNSGDGRINFGLGASDYIINNSNSFDIVKNNQIRLNIFETTGEVTINGAIRATNALTDPSTGLINFGNSAGGDNSIEFDLGQTLSFSTNGNEKLLIAPSGEVTINGAIRATNALTDPSTGLINFGNSAGGDNSIEFDLGQTLSFSTNGNKNLVITSSGDIGMGVTAPAAKLHVLTLAGGNGEALRLENNNSNGNVAIQFHQAGNVLPRSLIQHNDFGDILRLRANYGDFVIETGSAGVATEQFRITTTGDVGIGTPAPGNKLHVVGDARITGPVQFDSELDMTNAKIVNVDTPTNNSDAANKQYVDNLIAGGFSFTNVYTLRTLANVPGSTYVFPAGMYQVVNEDLINGQVIFEVFIDSAWTKIFDGNNVSSTPPATGTGNLPHSQRMYTIISDGTNARAILFSSGGTLIRRRFKELRVFG